MKVSGDEAEQLIRVAPHEEIDRVNARGIFGVRPRAGNEVNRLFLAVHEGAGMEVPLRIHKVDPRGAGFGIFRCIFQSIWGNKLGNEYKTHVEGNQNNSANDSGAVTLELPPYQAP